MIHPELRDDAKLKEAVAARLEDHDGSDDKLAVDGNHIVARDLASVESEIT